MPSRRVPRALRDRVAAQARHRCGYCLTTEAVAGSSMEIDHIIPWAEGGPTVEENLWLVCTGCNKRKGNRIAALDPETGRLVSLFDPRRNVWQEHFVWSTDGTLVAGLTPVGRVTVEALRLNRPELVRARRRWVTVGWHPPAD
jgi:5-methylcytosine-specific restriction endonuclease McrA